MKNGKISNSLAPTVFIDFSAMKDGANAEEFAECVWKLHRFFTVNYYVEDAEQGVLALDVVPDYHLWIKPIKQVAMELFRRKIFMLTSPERLARFGGKGKVLSLSTLPLLFRNKFK